MELQATLTSIIWKFLQYKRKRTSAGVDCCGTERLPHDRLTDVCGDKKRDSGTETVALLEQLVQKQHDETRHEELDDDEQTDTRADLWRVTVHSGHHVHDGLTHCDHHTKHWNIGVDTVKIKDHTDRLDALIVIITDIDTRLLTVKTWISTATTTPTYRCS